MGNGKAGKGGYGYAQLLEELVDPWNKFPVLGRQSAIIAHSFLTLRSSDPHICNAFANLTKAGADVEVLDRILARLVYLEGCQKNPKKRLILEQVIRCADKLEATVKKAYGKSVDLIPGVMANISAIRSKIKEDLEAWPKSRRNRGPGPQTPILVSLLKYVQKCTGELHYEDVATIISTAYMVAGSNRECDPENLAKLFQHNPDLQKNWERRIKTNLSGTQLLGKTKLPPPPKAQSRNRDSWLN